MSVEKSYDRATARALEAYLVAAYLAGDAAALDKLVRLISPTLYAHACRLLGDQETARDITQSAWLETLKALPKLRDPSAVRAFALQIVTRQVARQIKHNQRDRSLLSELSEEPFENGEDMNETLADARKIRTAIHGLPPIHRATIALFYLEDMSVAEVATALDVPVGTVKTRLMHARENLRATLEGDTK